MKYLKLLSISLILTVNSFGQTPQGFMYQAYIRDDAGKAMSNKEMDVKVSLIEGSLEGDVIYTEIHKVYSSQNGVLSLTVGEGGYQNVDFEKIDWHRNPLYIKVAVKYGDLTDFILISGSKIMSVPYAIHAQYSENGVTDDDQEFVGTKRFNNGIEGNLSGGIILDNNTPATPGALRWNGTDFLGYNGFEWISLTAGGGGAVNDSINTWVCGEDFIDARNGKSYRTVFIANQCWMRDNLNFETTSGSYTGTGDYAPEIVGRYYTWAGVMNISDSYNEEFYDGSTINVQGACPSGWHVPTHDEWNVLGMQQNINGITLQEGGASNFDARLAGDRLENGTFANSGISAIFWTSTQISNVDSYKRILFEGEVGIGVFIFDKSSSFSVRCLKD